MEGCLRKRGGRWYFSIELASIDGKRKRIERAGGRTKKEAEAALRSALQEYKNAGSFFEPAEMSFADYLDYWYENYVKLNLAYNTNLGYINIIEKHLKPALGMFYLKDITPAALQEFVNKKYLTGISKAHLTNIMGVLSGALKAAVHPYQFIKDFPMAYVTTPKYELKKSEIGERIISPEEFARITERFPLGTMSYIVLMIGYYTGCRIGEITGLTWDDIDLDGKTLSINKQAYKREHAWCFGPTKTSMSVRTIEIGDTLISALKKHKALQAANRLKFGSYYIQQYETQEVVQQKTIRHIHSLPLSSKMNIVPHKKIDMVCTKEDGELVTSDSVKYCSRVINYVLNIPFNFHALRHTHTTILVENGANVKAVQFRLGHSRIDTTMNIYANVTEKMKTESVGIFEKAAKLPTA